MQTAPAIIVAVLCVYAGNAFAQTAGTAGRGNRNAQSARPAITIQVTDFGGNPLPDVWVKASGPVDRELATDENGFVTFRTMAPGTYRLRFEHEEFVTLERDVTHAARPSKVSVALSAASSKPEPTPAEPPPPSPPSLPPAGPPTFVSIPDFFEKNWVGSAPSLVSQVGCVPSAITQLLQLREPLSEHTHPDADEVIYIVAGDGTHRINGQDVPLEAGVFATVPRGSSHSITRRGRNPIIVLSVVTEPCAQTKK